MMKYQTLIFYRGAKKICRRPELKTKSECSRLLKQLHSIGFYDAVIFWPCSEPIPEYLSKRIKDAEPEQKREGVAS